MARFNVNDTVRVRMPRGVNKRGVMGISVLYSTLPETRFDGATGTVTEVNPRGPYGVPLYLVDFRAHDNRTAIPWHSHWFREEWLTATERPATESAPAGERAAASGTGQTTTRGST